jgi:hypothetical protein
VRLLALLGATWGVAGLAVLALGAVPAAWLGGLPGAALVALFIGGTLWLAASVASWLHDRWRP